MDNLHRILPLSSLKLNPVDLWKLVTDLLQERSVQFRTLSEGMLQRAPSRRLRIGALVCPGSDLSHVLFMSPLDDHRVLMIGYSKDLMFSEAKKGELEMIAGKLNETSSIGLWKVESKDGNCFPVLETVVGPLACEIEHAEDSSAKVFLWRCFGTIDEAFKESRDDFLYPNTLGSGGLVRKVKKFLEQKGFKKVKESMIPGGVSYLVGLSSDNEEESSPVKQFLMKIDVAEFLTFSIYFSLSNSVVKAKNGFINASKRLLAAMNLSFPVGFYSYSSNTSELRYILKLNYRTLLPADLKTSLKTYFDSAISYYQWSLRAFAAMHKKTSEGGSVSDVLDATDHLGDKVQGDIAWKRVELKGSVAIYAALLRKMEASPELANFFLPHPFYRTSESGQVLVKTSRSLLPVRSFLVETRRDCLCQVLLELALKLLNVGVFPTNDMLFCTSKSPFQLSIIPDAGLHEDQKRYFDDFREFVQSPSHSPEELKRRLDSGLLFIKPDSLKGNMPTMMDHYKLVRDSVTSEEYILYHIDAPARALRFQLILHLYMSKLEELPEYLNKVIGFTEITDFDDSYGQSDEGGFFLCEKYCLQFYGSDSLFTSMLSFLDEVEKLHSLNLYHWFICPLTLRQGCIDTEFKDRKQLVLPCLGHYFAVFVYSCLNKPCKGYLAPEVKQFLETGKLMANPFAADVYSFCKCILNKARIAKPLELQSVGEAHAYEALRRGLSSDPKERPNLQEVRQAIETLRRSQEIDK